MNDVQLFYGLYRGDKSHIKLKGSKLQIAQRYLQESISVIRSILDVSMQDIQNTRYELLKTVSSSVFKSSDESLYIMLSLTDRQLEILNKEMSDGCFSVKNDDEEEYYGAWDMNTGYTAEK